MYLPPSAEFGDVRRGLSMHQISVDSLFAFANYMCGTFVSYGCVAPSSATIHGCIYLTNGSIDGRLVRWAPQTVTENFENRLRGFAQSKHATPFADANCTLRHTHARPRPW